MSKIVNEARIKNKLIVRIRELLEHRAFWLYLLVDEAELARRRAGLVPPQKECPYPVLRRYASMVSSADSGAMYKKV